MSIISIATGAGPIAGMAVGAASSVIPAISAIKGVFKSSNKNHYYKKYFSQDDDIYEKLIDILNYHVDSPHTHCVGKSPKGRNIALDMLCFRHNAGWWDYSDYACMKVRIQYDPYLQQCLVVCKKRYQLESFVNRFCAIDFKPSRLVLIGAS